MPFALVGCPLLEAVVQLHFFFGTEVHSRRDLSDRSIDRLRSFGSMVNPEETYDLLSKIGDGSFGVVYKG